MAWWMNLGWLLVSVAHAQEVRDDNCGQIWADHFNPSGEPAPPTGNALFQAADALGRIGRRQPREVIVASCTAGEPNTSTTDLWDGQFWTNDAGQRVIMGNCTTVNVVEVQGKRRNRCRLFATSRICTHVDNPQDVNVLVGGSSIVPCEGATE